MTFIMEIVYIHTNKYVPNFHFVIYLPEFKKAS